VGTSATLGWGLVVLLSEVVQVSPTHILWILIDFPVPSCHVLVFSSLWSRTAALSVMVQPLILEWLAIKISSRSGQILVKRN